MNDIIYVNGDSFTEGCEIGDHLTELWTGYYSLNDFVSLGQESLQKRQQDYVDKAIRYYNTHPEIAKLTKDFQEKNRWSAVLGRILDRPVCNISSQGGSSLYAISFRTVQDIQLLKKKNYNITDIIIQLTGSFRYSIFKHTNDGEEPNPEKFPHYKIISFNAGSVDKNLQKVMETYYNHELDFGQHRFLFDLFLLEKTLKSITNARIIFVDSLFYTTSPLLESPWDTIEFEEGHFLNDVVRDYKNKTKLSMISTIKLEEANTVTGGLHFTSNVHKRFAKLIAKEYFL